MAKSFMDLAAGVAMSIMALSTFVDHGAADSLPDDERGPAAITGQMNSTATASAVLTTTALVENAITGDGHEVLRPESDGAPALVFSDVSGGMLLQRNGKAVFASVSVDPPVIRVTPVRSFMQTGSGSAEM